MKLKAFTSAGFKLLIALGAEVLIGVVLGVFLLSQSAFAAYFCSTRQGNGYINIGDGVAQVESACGKATSTKTQVVPDQSFETTQYLMYSNTLTSQSIPLGVQGQQTAINQDGPSVVFQVKGGQVVGINEHGRAVQNTSACGGSVSIGTPTNSVLSECGRPTSTDMQNKASEKTRKITTWIYDRGQYQSALTLQFDGKGKLTSINE